MLILPRDINVSYVCGGGFRIFRDKQTQKNDGNLTVNIEASLLNFHNARIYLAHVTATICLFELPDAKLPGPQVVVCHCYSGVVCYNFGV